MRLPRNRDPFRDLFGQGDDGPERFFSPAPEGERGERRTRTSLGSGFVIDDQGYILTNRHVIEGADEINVSFPDGKRYEAKIVGQDARTDVALIKIEPKGTLTPIPLGNSDQVEVGEWVMAVGNPFGLPGGGNSVTVGVVSFKGRDLELGVRNTSVEMIQTDAAINPGNSGGPLINTRGEVVGINTLIVTGGAQASAGVGFSVPINVAKDILAQLRDKGKVTRGWMGVTIGADERGPRRDLRPRRGEGRARQLGEPRLARRQGRPAARGRDPQGRRQADPGQRRPVAPHRVARSRDHGQARAGARQGQEERQRDARHLPRPDVRRQRAREAGRASLGMTLRDLTPAVAERIGLPRDTKGVVVMEVEAGEVAEDAGPAPRRRDRHRQRPAGGARPRRSRAPIAAARPAGRARLRVYNAQIEGYRMVALRLK